MTGQPGLVLDPPANTAYLGTPATSVTLRQFVGNARRVAAPVPRVLACAPSCPTCPGWMAFRTPSVFRDKARYVNL